jgi:4-amino-4-deoxychorismate lyase
LTPRVLVDGVAAGRLPATDRGLQYGDGLFETLAVRGSAPCLWSAHFERLSLGAQRLGLPCPPEELLLRECRRLTNASAPCVLKIILTRGSGGRGYRPPAHPRPTRILMRHPWPDHPPAWYEEGVDVVFCRMRLGSNPALARIKHLNRLEQVLARAEIGDPRIAEGIMCDGEGRVIGGTMSNLFAVAGDRLLTPRLDGCGIAGTVRAQVLRLAGAGGLEAEETDLTPGDLAAADGMFLTNSLIGVWPVRRMESSTFGLESLPERLIREVRELALTP